MVEMTDRDSLTRVLLDNMAFQRKWKTISMTMYATTTVGIIVFSAGAALIAAQGTHNETAAVLAAATTVLAGIEKSFLFREKWKLHLTILARLQAIKLDVDTTSVDPKEVIKAVKDVLATYVAELPIVPHEG